MKKWLYNSIFYRIWKRFLTWFDDVMLATAPPKVRAKHLRAEEGIIYGNDLVKAFRIVYETTDLK